MRSKANGVGAYLQSGHGLHHHLFPGPLGPLNLPLPNGVLLDLHRPNKSDVEDIPSRSYAALRVHNPGQVPLRASPFAPVARGRIPAAPFAAGGALAVRVGPLQGVFEEIQRVFFAVGRGAFLLFEGEAAHVDVDVLIQGLGDVVRFPVGMSLEGRASHSRRDRVFFVFVVVFAHGELFVESLVEHFEHALQALLEGRGALAFVQPRGDSRLLPEGGLYLTLFVSVWERGDDAVQVRCLLWLVRLHLGGGEAGEGRRGGGGGPVRGQRNLGLARLRRGRVSRGWQHGDNFGGGVGVRLVGG